MPKTNQTTFIFNMGDRVKDVISGFEGVVIGRFEYWTGCNHYGVEAAATKDSKTPYENLDEQRLELVEAGAVKLAREYEQQVEAEQPKPKRRSPGAPVQRNPQRPA